MLGKKLKNIREAIGLTVEEFSTKLDIKKRAYMSYEYDERKPTFEFFEIICKNFNVNLNWLIADKGEMFIQKESIAPTDSKISDDELETKINAILKKHGVI